VGKSLLYSFHPLAIEQQSDIWLYTYKNWGEAQADKYIDKLHNQLSKVAETTSLLRDVPQHIVKGIKFFHCGRHYIFVKLATSHLNETIQVLTILHESMDIPNKLREILDSYIAHPDYYK
jgi:toxin ParE1/3/4